MSNTNPEKGGNEIVPDDDMSMVVEEMFRLKAIIEQATEQYDALRAGLAARLREGDTVKTDNGTISYHSAKRFNADRAKEVLQPAVVEAISEMTVSPKLAKEFLSPHLYKACQVAGKPIIYVYLPKQGK